MVYVNRRLVDEQGWRAGVFLPDIYLETSVKDLELDCSRFTGTPWYRAIGVPVTRGRSVVVLTSVTGCVEQVRERTCSGDSLMIAQARLSDVSGRSLVARVQSGVAVELGRLQGSDALLLAQGWTTRYLLSGDFYADSNLDVAAVKGALLGL
ncbi:hypothetical protein COY28_00915 [Candidatus Woesearchaeota archaeon CG_4_10_14_0_2_um_filter_57_5]|nr:MAG: hypothetical protein AUJ68_01925 [Candidatus Woesearchaeota archaeon CG1_02_57_44]PIZ56498.1 MAG: hypothetical protein COY28_00915 [Candidatus Woesearchaeota archaeon CG_4_10_14_0_2_um_filter_57_5]